VAKETITKSKTNFDFKNIEKKTNIDAVDELTKILDKGNE